jgi:hypothetical protein
MQVVKMFLIAVAIAMVPPPERWVRIGGSANLYEESVDNESVRRTGDKVTLWTRRTSTLGDVTVWQEIEISCSMKNAAILAYIRDDSGAISHNDVRPHRAASPISPNSVEEKLFNIACR